jgi:dTDP-4-amino-4,6-dideoxygalactose transaminase
VSLASGRDALHWIIAALGLDPGSQVLLPAYLCESVVKPFVASGMRVVFYGITRDLRVDTADLARKLSPETKILLYIHYFGFPLELPSEVIIAAGTQVITVEDSSHALLSRLDRLPIRGDIEFASYRKLLPIPNGAVASWNAQRLPHLKPVRSRFSVQNLEAISFRCAGGLFKGLWLQSPWVYPKGTFRWLFFRSDTLLDAYPKPAGMSAISRHLLGRIDLERVIQARQQNFRYLLARLGGRDDLRPMYASLPQEVCPLGFPVLAEDRDGLARHLINHQIYPPVHWALPRVVDRGEFPEAWAVSDRILTIPIDQRYTVEDMARIVSVINSYKPEKVLWPAGH